jgi:predicted Zn-dependent peptidase
MRAPLDTDAPLSQRVVDVTEGAARVLACPVPVRDVVSFRGSFETAPDLASDDDVLQQLVVDLMDKGTRRRDRFEIADVLDGRGAQLHLYADTLRAGFAGRCLREDLPVVLEILFEELREPAFPEDEFEKERRKSIAAVRRSLDSTAGQATGALTRRLYPAAHPNYVPEPQTELANIEAATLERVTHFHVAHVSPRSLTIAVVGDIDPGEAAAQVSAASADWQSDAQRATFDAAARPAAPGRIDVAIADRPNLDVRMGHALDLRRDALDWHAAHAAAFALGGNFSSRLMRIVRDEQGLTYGIGASLHNVAVEHDGHLLIYASLSADRLGEGLGSINGVIGDFVASGITGDELERVQSTLAGQHVVALATTSGLATRLLVNAERGFEVTYLDRYPDEVRSLTVPQVNEALRKHVRPDDLHVAVAGSLLSGQP